MAVIVYYLEGIMSYLDEEIKLQQDFIFFLAVKKKIILFCIPGAFTLTCSMRNVPWFVEKKK